MVLVTRQSIGLLLDIEEERFWFKRNVHGLTFALSTMLRPSGLGDPKKIATKNAVDLRGVIAKS